MTSETEAEKEEKSIFVEVFGDYPLVRVLDFLLTFREFDYSLTEIAENSNVAWSTLHELFPKIRELGIVKQTRQIGRAKLYKLNTDSPLVQRLIQVENELIGHICRQFESKKIPA